MVTFHSQRPDAAHRYRVSLHGDHAVGPHFRVREFRCKDGTDELRIHPALVELLERIRTHFGKPVVINSAFRTEGHNRRVGGSPNSKHLLGMAADIRIPAGASGQGVTPEQVAAFADSLHVGGRGLYDTFVHVDCFGQNRRWDGRS